MKCLCVLSLAMVLVFVISSAHGSCNTDPVRPSLDVNFNGNVPPEAVLGSWMSAMCSAYVGNDSGGLVWAMIAESSLKVLIIDTEGNQRVVVGVKETPYYDALSTKKATTNECGNFLISSEWRFTVSERMEGAYVVCMAHPVTTTVSMEDIHDTSDPLRAESKKFRLVIDFLHREPSEKQGPPNNESDDDRKIPVEGSKTGQRWPSDDVQRQLMREWGLEHLLVPASILGLLLIALSMACVIRYGEEQEAKTSGTNSSSAISNISHVLQEKVSPNSLASSSLRGTDTDTSTDTMSSVGSSVSVMSAISAKSATSATTDSSTNLSATASVTSAVSLPKPLNILKNLKGR